MQDMILDRFANEITYSYSTRQGGVSSGVYATMNLSFSMGDDPECVKQNYEIWLSDNGVNVADIVSLQQVHSANVLVATEAERGRGPVTEDRIPGFDAIVTNVPGLVLVTGHADCVPVYIYDPLAKAIGLAHAGWRGTVREIAARTVEAMVREYGSNPADMVAWIGPCIHIDAFECDGDVIEGIKAMSIDAVDTYYYNEESGKYHASLPDLNKKVLEHAGVKASNIGISNHCTYTMNELYFSHRRDGNMRGGQAAMLMIK